MQPFFSLDDVIEMAPKMDQEGLALLMIEVADESWLYDDCEWGTIVYVFEQCADDLLHRVR